MLAKKAIRRKKIHYKIRKRIEGTADRPRLYVFRSNKQIYASIINDTIGHTLCTASSAGISDGNKTDSAKKVGAAIAEKAKAAGIENVIFDRGGYLYHGRVKALAEGAREAGLAF